MGEGVGRKAGEGDRSSAPLHSMRVTSRPFQPPTGACSQANIKAESSFSPVHIKNNAAFHKSPLLKPPSKLSVVISVGGALEDN